MAGTGVNGSDFFIYVNTSGDSENPNYVEVAGQKEYSANRRAATLDFSCKRTGKYASRRSGRIEADLNFGGLYELEDPGFAALEVAFDAGDPVRVLEEVEGVPTRFADVFVTGIEEQANEESPATRSISCVLDGPWQPAS